MQNMWKTMHVRGSWQIEKLWSCYQAEANLDGSRICRGSISQTECLEILAWWIEKLSRCCWDSVKNKPRNLDGSKISRDAINVEVRKLNRSGICQGSVEKLSSLKKMSFSREEKHIKMNATSKLLKQRSNQHVKLSRHLSTYKHIDPKKHTHTHTQQV